MEQLPFAPRKPHLSLQRKATLASVTPPVSSYFGRSAFLARQLQATAARRKWSQLAPPIRPSRMATPPICRRSSKAAAAGPVRPARPGPPGISCPADSKTTDFSPAVGAAEQLATDFIRRLALDADRDVGTGQVQGPLPRRHLLGIAEHVGVSQFPLAGRPRNARDDLVVDRHEPPCRRTPGRTWSARNRAGWKAPASPGRRRRGPPRRRNRCATGSPGAAIP